MAEHRPPCKARPLESDQDHNGGAGPPQELQGGQEAEKRTHRGRRGPTVKSRLVGRDLEHIGGSWVLDP